MASDKATTLLTSLPLEVRHTIFDYTTARQTKPKKLLRYWFEKKETKELVAKHVADNPKDAAPQVVYHQEREVDSEPEPEAEEDEDNEDAEEDSENEDEEDADEEEDDGGDNGNGENEDDVVDQDGDDVDPEGSEDEEDEEDATDENGGTHVTGTGTTQTSTSVPPQSVPTPAMSASQAHAQTALIDQDEEAGSDAEDECADQDNAATQDGDGDQVMAEEADEDGSDEEEENEGEEDTADATADAAGSAPPPPPAAVVISPHHKWRHIPNFLRISHCPPPVELLLASKQLNEEARNWFYDVAVLRISATSSFAHTSFFEEAFSQITEAAFSPMENIRKVEVLFVWDTTWLRAEETGSAEAIFPALLRQRGNFVHQILSQAPDLREVTIHWHDSAQDNESANFMLDILAPFHSLNANVQIKEHYIAADAKPHKKSIAGQRRLEFQHIFDAGLDRLF